MLLVLGTIETDPAKLDELESAAITMTAETLNEEGCLDYAASREIGQPGRLRLTEIWTGVDALKAHFATPHMAEFNAAIAASQARFTRFDVFGYESGEAISLDKLLAD